MATTIPMTGDVAALIGPLAERVENRSLLLDKFIFHKSWPETLDDRGRQVKWDEASRLSLLRIAEGARAQLSTEAAEKRKQAGREDVEPQKRDRMIAEAELAEALAKINWDKRELATLRARHTRRFLSLFRTAHPQRSAVTIGQLEGRLAINLCNGLIQNAGISLDRLFGLPYIPGSAVKGVCRHAALAEFKAAKGDEKQESFNTFRSVFGTADNDFKNGGDFEGFTDLLQNRAQDQKGAVAFLPSYPVNEARLVVDLTNVHFPEYYSTGETKDLSKEKPQPNPFPAVEQGAQFAFCLLLNGIKNDPKLLIAATRWLETALTVHGLGAKTASGYGWFSIQPAILDALEKEEAREREAAAAVAIKAAEEAQKRQAAEERKASLSPEDLAAEALLALNDEHFALFAKEIASKPEIEQRAFIGLLTGNKDKRERWKTWKKKKPEIAKPIEEIRLALNLPSLP